LYHADIGSFGGGFLGVDVFLVISGYLITSLLVAEWRATGSIDLASFWMRRARRLLPALYVLLGGVLAFALVALPDEVARLRVDAAAAIGYVTNWYLVAGQQSYFEAIGRPSLLRHLWSLAVEEQFYVAWPVVLAVGLAVLRRRLTLVVTVGLAIASAAAMAAMFRPDVDPARVYYGTDTRLIGLLAGATLGLRGPRRPGHQARPLVDRVVDGIAFLAVAALFGAFLLVDETSDFLYPGGFALVALATAMAIAAIAHGQGRLPARLLDGPPLRWVGLRSYSIYLWHWPLFVVTRPGLDVPLDPVADLALRAAITLVLAEVSYRFVEAPIRRGAVGRMLSTLRAAGDRSRRVTVGLVAAGGALALGCSLTVVAIVGAAQPVPPAYLAATSVEGVIEPDADPAAGDATGTPGIAVPPAHLGSVARSTGSDIAQDAPGSARPGKPAATGAPPSERVGGPAGPADPAASPPGVRRPPAAPAPSPPSSPPPPASAAPAPSSSPRPPRVLAIGDSVMVGAARALARAVGPIEVDAVVGRQFGEAIRILDEHRAAGTLPD
ncbi:MAG TPA: acyltransferase family protein, partial [Candidatus Limnocylindrales bacterium]